MDILTTSEVIGAWISIFLTVAVLSFLFDDNPIYKFAEHLFMGIAIGYGVVEAYWNLLKPNMQDKLVEAFNGETSQYIYVIPLVLSIMLLFKVSKKYGWLARIPIATLVAAYAAVKITGETSGKLIGQIGASFPNLSKSWEAHGVWDWQADGAGVFSDVFLVVALSACLIHFYFSEVSDRAQRYGMGIGSAVFIGVGILAMVYSPLPGTLGKTVVAFGLATCAAAPFLTLSPYKPYLTRFGVMVLMVSFGASFGFTVMGRISLAIGRAQEMLGQNRPPEEVAIIHPLAATFISLGLLVVGMMLLKRMSSSEHEATDD